MPIRQYSREQLLHLRSSPLVKKPDDLPAIEQWIEYVYLDIDGAREKLRIPHSESQQPQQAAQREPASGRQTRQAKNADASPMGSFGSTGPSAGRPSLSGRKVTGGEYRCDCDYCESRLERC